MSDKELQGRVAVITGAGRSIGRAMALELAEGGCAVVVNVRSNRAEAEAVVKDVESKGGRGMVGVADVVDAKAVHAMADAALKKFGRIDYLINNAALRGEKHLDEMTFAEWRKILSVILDGAFHCVKACLPQLRRSGAGAVVNIGGLSAHTGAKHRIHVITAKAGLVGFTRGLAHDLAADNVTVNCISPGLINTPRDPNAPEPQHHAIHNTLSGKRGTSEDVAAAVRFLCGPGARYVTGQTIHVNGGAFLT